MIGHGKVMEIAKSWKKVMENDMKHVEIQKFSPGVTPPDPPKGTGSRELRKQGQKFTGQYCIVALQVMNVPAAVYKGASSASATLKMHQNNALNVTRCITVRSQWHNREKWSWKSHGKVIEKSWKSHGI